MNREEKKLSVAELKNNFEKAQFAVLADFRGLTVTEMTTLRKKLHEHHFDFKVVKNRLAKLACKETPFEVVHNDFVGPTAVGFSYSGPAPLAKTLVDFNKSTGEHFSVKVAVLGGKRLIVNDIQALAELPSRE